MNNKIILNSMLESNRSANLLSLKEIIIAAFRRKHIFVEVLELAENDGILSISLKVFALSKFRSILVKTMKNVDSFSIKQGGVSQKILKNHVHKKRASANQIKRRYGSFLNYFLSRKRNKYKSFLNSLRSFTRFFPAHYIDNSKNFKIEQFLKDVLYSATLRIGFTPKTILLNIVSMNTLFDYFTQNQALQKKQYAVRKFTKINKKYASRLFIRKSKELGKDIEIASWLLASKQMSPSIFLEILVLLFLPMYKKRHNLFLRYIKDLFKEIVSNPNSLVAGFHFTISGKLSGKSMASVRSFTVGSVQNKPITNSILKTGTNKIGTYGLKLTVNYYPLPILNSQYFQSRNGQVNTILRSYLLAHGNSVNSSNSLLQKKSLLPTLHRLKFLNNNNKVLVVASVGIKNLLKDKQKSLYSKRLLLSLYQQNLQLFSSSKITNNKKFGQKRRLFLFKRFERRCRKVFLKNLIKNYFDSKSARVRYQYCKILKKNKVNYQKLIFKKLKVKYNI
jgi:hypothetical protein